MEDLGVMMGDTRHEGRDISRVVVTGADGFVGSHVVSNLLSHGAEVVAVDLPRAPSRLKPADGLYYISYDCMDAEHFAGAIPAGRLDAVLHFAWMGSAGPGRTDYDLQMSNALATAKLVKAVSALGCGCFVGAGSIMEREVECSIHEQGSRPGMAYLYGLGKLAAHDLCKIVAAECGIECVWPMITNAYGPGESSPRFLNTTLRKVISGEELSFTAATQRYDFVYIDDVAEAFRLAAERGRDGYEYLIGSGDAKPLREFIVELLAAVAPNAAPKFGDIPYTGTDMPPEAFSTSAIERDCGWVPRIPFAEGALLTMAWLRSGGGSTI